MRSVFATPLRGLAAGALALGLACSVALAQDARDAASAARSPPRQKVVLNADPLFSFGSAQLSPASRAALDDFVRASELMSAGPIRLVGHADRLGSEARNQILSEERADAVKAYLVSRGIEETRIRVESKGNTQPATQAEACGSGSSARTIACLQPDRRVAVEVAGTRILKLSNLQKKEAP
ncbi:MAG: OmpA family protein [Betaproteobacteria bacterium]|nr:MAG: OmpA family protein [Betaproteobacteria bacterium]